MMRNRKLVACLLTALLLLGATPLGRAAWASENGTLIDTSDMFTERDLETDYNEESCDYITLSDESISTTASHVAISGSTITIQDEGMYILSGTLSDGMVIIDAEDTDKIQLILNGVNIVSSTSAAIYIREADKVFITTAAGTENTLSNGGVYEAIDDNHIDAVVFSKSDLTLNGTGTLIVYAPEGHGIVSKDDLVCASGAYEITTASHGLSGKDSVRIAGGEYTITAGKDGIHAENADDASLGYLYIAGGTFFITADGDGMSAASYLLVEDGDFSILSGGGSTNAAQTSAGNDRFFGFPGDAQSDTQEDAESTKGIKAGSELMLSQGTFVIDSADDALHTNGNLSIYGGTFLMSTGDDGIHADNAVLISDGSIDITQSYEGIEGLTIDITGGTITLVSSDDGLNAAGGNDSSGFGRGRDMFSTTEGAYIHIAGGILSIDASGDGIDSNGDLLMSGGEVYVSGPSGSGNGALDYNGSGTITGGIIIAAGASGMAQNFDASSTQGVMMVNVGSAAAGSTITLSDSAGNVLLSWQATKAYASVVISCPEIVQGDTYTLTINGAATQIVMNSLVFSSGGRGNGSDWGGSKGGGGRNRP